MGIDRIKDMVKEDRYNFRFYIDIPDEITHPDHDWQHGCNNWVNYVPGGLKKSWNELSEESQAIIYWMASIQAFQEVWE